MKTYEFTVIVPELDDSTADAIYGLSPDSSIGATHGVNYVAFDRKADTLEHAIQGAVSQLRNLGVEPLRIELDVPALVPS